MGFSQLKKLVFTCLAITGTFSAITAFGQQLLNPATQPKFVNQLTAPSVIDASNGLPQPLVITVSQFPKDLGLKQPGTGSPLMTTVWGYNGEYPGPTILARKDVPLDVRL